MEYIFIFTFSVILAVTVGLFLGAIVALLSKNNKRRYFQRTFCYTSIAVAVFIFFLVFIK